MPCYNCASHSNSSSIAIAIFSEVVIIGYVIKYFTQLDIIKLVNLSGLCIFIYIFLTVGVTVPFASSETSKALSALISALFCATVSFYGCFKCSFVHIV